ncbi:hypothetical protein LEP1GSC202_1747 [Leptospira yanagawae serovar Saopaulo str. Sao Paulo = ATCC 700523]|uniref:Uncharacterized protein n=1 Tax=Leptospira yanagawae serovar Saopaulo str. Sao Paulo = ATCC 700523 TaxID=1249483 RepID=A0A5E8HCV6_9LEPT|nr:hypothetical protein LEP1GSC202_1747 [Leptospira yanagawae serovar Saopaulo str. Sao Paulo = ATCC 700523]
MNLNFFLGKFNFQILSFNGHVSIGQVGRNIPLDRSFMNSYNTTQFESLVR